MNFPTWNSSGQKLNILTFIKNGRISCYWAGTMIHSLQSTVVEPPAATAEVLQTAELPHNRSVYGYVKCTSSGISDLLRSYSCWCFERNQIGASHSTHVFSLESEEEKAIALMKAPHSSRNPDFSGSSIHTSNNPLLFRLDALIVGHPMTEGAG